MRRAWPPSSGPSNVPLIVPGTGGFLKAASPVSGPCLVAFRPSLGFSAWPEARLIGGLLPGAMPSVVVTSCAPTLVLWDTLRVVYKEKQVVFKVYT